MVQRKNLILSFIGLVIVLMAVLVLASHGADNVIDAPALNSPVTLQNISNVSGGYLVLNASFDPQYNRSLIINVTFRFQNTTGYFVLNTTVQNSSVNQTIFQNLTFLSTLLADGKYNITVTAVNGTVATNQSFIINSSAAKNITIDNTPPNVTLLFVNNLVNGSNYSFSSASATNGTFNASVFDAATNVANVYFWFDNGTSADFNVSGINISGAWYVSYNLSWLAEQKQGVRIVANDSVGNINNTAMINFTIDFSAPNVSVVTLNSNPGNASNFSLRTNNQTFNFTLFDSLTNVQSAYFWFDNGTGQDFNMTATNQSGEWIVSYNVSALGEGRQGLRVRANDTVGNINNTALNFTIDFTSPNVTVNSLNARNIYNGTNFSLASNNYTFNVSLVDALTEISNVYFYFDNGTNGTSRGFNVSGVNLSGVWTISYNISALGEGVQGVRLFVNDTVNNMNSSTIFNFTMDKTIPGVTVTVSSVSSTSGTLTASVNSTGANNCTFSGSEVGSNGILSGTALTANGAKTSWTSTLDLIPSTSYTVTVTCNDHAGNSGSGVTSFTATAAASTSNGGGGSGGSSGGVSTSVQGSFEKKVWTSINAGETASVTLKNGAVGVTEVSLTVPQTVYGAWIQVAKKDSLPSSVSSFSGKVYRNVEITKGPALAKEGAYTDATVKFKVEKAWLAQNGVAKEAVALHHYGDGKWVELQTQVGEDDGTYVHYSAKTPSFSYFVVGEKSGEQAAVTAPAAEVPAEQPAAVEAPAEVPAEAEAPAAEKKGLSTGWLVGLLVALAVVVALVLYLRRRR